MRPTVSTGDLALAAQPAAEETFQPYGRLLAPGGRAYLGKRGRVLVAVDRRRRGPRRVSHLQRCPQARRAYVPAGAAASWLVVLGAGPEAEPAAFLLPAGWGVVLNAGVWHAGPAPLEDTTVCEMLETMGPADRFDRESLRELAGVEAIRVLLPEEPGAPLTGFDLTAPNAVLLDASLHGRLRLGCLLIEDIAAGDVVPDLETELRRAVSGLRAMWGHASDLGEIPGIAAGRDLYREVGLDATQVVPAAEALVGRVLAGEDPAAASALEATALLCALRLRAPLGLYDAAHLGAQVIARLGGPGESYAEEGAGGISREGHPLLADRTGAFGSPLGDARRAVAGPATRRGLAVLFLPPTLEDAALEALLDGVGKALTSHTGGRVGARLTVG